MDIIQLGFIYVGILGFYVCVLVLGETPMFRNTPIGWVHWALTEGLGYLFSSCMRCVAGERGVAACRRLGIVICERPNPALQYFYLGVVAAGYYIFCTEAYPHLPGPLIGAWHRLAAPVVVLVGFALFFATSLMDPGTIDDSTVEANHACYPPDGVIYPAGRGTCPTCRYRGDRPARSKHCDVCDRCVSRLDHHCGWMNNCIGERNIRYFLGFLIYHALLCSYATWICITILRGVVLESGLRTARLRGRDGEMMSGANFKLTIEYLLVFNGNLLMLTVFCSLVAVLLYVFFGYHMFLVYSGTTTNESVKWGKVQMEVEARARAEEEARLASGGLASDAMRAVVRKGSFWSRFVRRAGAEPIEYPSNAYDNGFFVNLYDVLFPPTARYSRKQASAAAKTAASSAGKRARAKKTR